MIRAWSAFRDCTPAAVALIGRPPRGMETAREIYTYLLHNPGSTSNQVAKGINRAATRSFVVSYVEALDAQGLMVYCETGPDGYTRWYAA